MLWQCLAEDIVIRIRKEQILVPDFFAGKGKMKEWMALTINWVSEGINCCCVGFLPNVFVHQANRWDGMLCQVVQVVEKDNHLKFCGAKWHKNKGYACIVVITNGFLPTNWRGSLPNKLEG